MLGRDIKDSGQLGVRFLASSCIAFRCADALLDEDGWEDCIDLPLPKLRDVNLRACVDRAAWLGLGRSHDVDVRIDHNGLLVDLLRRLC